MKRTLLTLTVLLMTFSVHAKNDKKPKDPPDYCYVVLDADNAIANEQAIAEAFAVHGVRFSVGECMQGKKGNNLVLIAGWDARKFEDWDQCLKDVKKAIGAKNIKELKGKQIEKQLAEDGCGPRKQAIQIH